MCRDLLALRSCSSACSARWLQTFADSGGSRSREHTHPSASPGPHLRVCYAKEALFRFHSIFTVRRERVFYWSAILFTFSLEPRRATSWPRKLGSADLVTGSSCVSSPHGIAGRLGLVQCSDWIAYYPDAPPRSVDRRRHSQSLENGGIGLGGDGHERGISGRPILMSSYSCGHNETCRATTPTKGGARKRRVWRVCKRGGCGLVLGVRSAGTTASSALFE